MRSRIIVKIIIFLIVAIPCHAQVEQPLAWLRDVTALDAGSSGSVLQIAAIRREVEEWIALHPSSGVDLPPPPPQPWSGDQLRTQIDVLKRAVESRFGSPWAAASFRRKGWSRVFSLMTRRGTRANIC